MNKNRYVALIRKEANTDYWVDIPDVPGCAASGATKEEAIASFQEILPFHLDGLKEVGGSLRPPRTLKEITAEDKDGYEEAFMIDVEQNF